MVIDINSTKNKYLTIGTQENPDTPCFFPKAVPLFALKSKMFQIVERCRMNVSDKICEIAKDLPEPLAREVLEFIERISAHQDIGIEDLKKAQETAMKRIWENKKDDIWNKL